MNDFALSRRAILGIIATGVFTVSLAEVGDAEAAPLAPSVVPLRLPGGGTATVDFEEYVKSVVPSEMSALWPLEALKAQAVAARTYAAAYMAAQGSICSTTSCQTWNPERRHARSDAAVDQTRGQVLTYQGKLIWAYYSSTCGGVTSAATGSAGAYCRSVRCWSEADGSGRDGASLADELAATVFWAGSTSIPSFCGRSPHYRWHAALGGSVLESILDRHLPAAVLGTPRYRVGDLRGLRDLRVIQRNASGRATRLRVAGGGGVWEVGGESAIRSVLRSAPDAAPQRSTGLAIVMDAGGARLVGGGWGHGVGLCQHGARGMADRGFDYRAILRHYYSGVDLTAI